MTRLGRIPWTWLAVAVLILACLRPVLGDWTHSVLAPFGGLDAAFQSALLEWGARHVFEPTVWIDLPIFFPAHGALAFMDPLTAQSLLIEPAHRLGATPAAQYNLACLLSLVLAAAAAATLWRATAGLAPASGRGAAGICALLLIGSPYTAAQLGHLNQLPPAGVPAAMAALVWTLMRWESGRNSAAGWWALAAALVGQAALGWYGFAYASIAVVVMGTGWILRRRRSLDWRPAVIRAAPALLAAGLGVWALAAPHLQAERDQTDFTRHTSEVRWYSADAKHLLNRGAYRAGPADWLGRGPDPATRHLGVDRQVLHPGWMALLLAGIGWATRRRLDPAAREWGGWLLLAGGAGLVLAFGDSVGLPFTDRRLPLPLAWLQAGFEPARAYRAAARFAFLFTLAVAWWGTAGWLRLAAVSRRRGRWLAGGAGVLLLLESVPVGVPTLALADQTVRRVDPIAGEAVLTLPAPPDVYHEDLREARWLWRALATGRPVTGGVSGWVPPVTRELRRALAAGEQGDLSADEIFAEVRSWGVTRVEIFAADTDPRLAHWRSVLMREAGAPQLEDGVQVWPLPAGP